MVKNDTTKTTVEKKKTSKEKLNKKNQISNLNDIEFQVIDWDYYHETETIDDDDPLKKYIIRMYGLTKDNKSVFVKVKEFTPYFFVEIPKTWKKQKAMVLIDTVKNEIEKYKPEYVNSLKSWDIVDRHIFWEFTNYKLFSFIRLIFHDYEGFRVYANAFNRKIKNPILDKFPKKYKVYESNIEPLLRCMHIRKVNAVGWIKIPGSKYEFFTDNENPSINEISIYTDWTNLEPIEDTSINKFVIASFDIECTSGDGEFPKPERDEDKVIQIGTTFSRYGESECFYKHIVTLGSCDPIEGVDVESYDNEVAVLLAWTKLIRRTNPDVLTGYNIFGFDYWYLEARAKKLGCHKSFTKLGKLKDVQSPYIDKELSSSALGQNILRYYAMHGRVQIDLMKVVQRDFKLGSYKLDNVISEFIKERIENVIIDKIKKTSTIITKNTYGLEVGRFVKVFFNDGLSDNSYKNDKKFKVLEMTAKSLTISGILDGEALEYKKYKVFWCQAKDDVSAKDIFKLQKGTSADRCTIARYCIQDCQICNKLINKLQVLTNNIGMANVCHVPLSYIFLRGQGVKIFSLVSKKCRERNHVIPVIRKPYKDDKKDSKIPPNAKKKFDTEEEEFDDDGYEGATVFKPTVGVHFEPITVLDYNSLYPNSQRHRNISHECIVKDKQYDNLPGYTYEEVTYSNKDGTKTTCRFAKSKNGNVGIVPEILTELLDARAKMRALIETEPDPFKQKILDGLQLAYKITANSLYGQCGAPTSPIYMKDIAASTTATGRELLNAARIFAEDIFPLIINSVFNDDYEEYVEKMDLLYKKQLDEFLGNVRIKELKEKVGSDDISDYHYLRIFKENKDIIDDKKFVDKKLNTTCKKEFVKWVYDKIKVVLKDYKIKPDVIYGDSVTKNTPVLLRYKDEIKIMKIEDIGKTWKDYNQFKSDDITLKEKQQDDNINLEVWTDKGWSKIKRVIRHKTPKEIYRICTHTGVVDVTEDHSLLDINGNKIKPKDCIVGETELLYGFPENLKEYNWNYSDNETYNKNTFISNDKLECMKYYYYSKENGYGVRIDVNGNDLILNRTTGKIDNPNKIISITKIGDAGSDYVYDLETDVGHFHAGVGELIVKNTDSIFIKYNIMDPETNEPLKTHEALGVSIELGMICSKLLHKMLPTPQNMAYEKTFWPFTILSKKRYVGNKYEFNDKDYYQNSMGIVLKRRDNAPIVKIVVGGIVNSILNEKSKDKAIQFTKKTLHDILSNKYPMDKFIITKTLKGPGLTKDERKIENQKSKENRFYADRTRIVHAVLADRMADRDPGNKPASNDRIPYAYILVNGDVDLQGDRVEHPEYIKEHKLKLDYLFYITNQIMKPSIQFLEHIMDNPDKMFKDVITKEMNRRQGKRPISYYFKLLNDLDNDKEDDVFGDVEEDDCDEEYNEKMDYKRIFTCSLNDNDDDNIDNDINSDIDKSDDEDVVVIKPKKTNKTGKKKKGSVNNKSKTKPKKKQIKLDNSLFDKNKGGFILEI